MKNRLKSIRSALSKINIVSVYILLVGVLLSTFTAVLSVIMKVYFLQNGGYAEHITDINGLWDMAPVLMFVFVLAAAAVDLAVRYIKNND